MRTTRILAKAAIGVLAVGFGLTAMWPLGYVGRPVLRVTSPDGRTEAICRGRLPEGTEYELWLRKSWAPFERRVGHVGTETMGHCQAIVWSSDGEQVAVMSKNGLVSLFNGSTGRAIVARWLVQPRSYPSDRVVTRVAFESRGVLAFEHCARLWHRTRRFEDLSRCDSAPIQGRMVVDAP